ncbi:hypothetical protein CFB82_40485 [Burkholderia sp. HI2714]|nr:hypothetical protein CFB82_40485 [Burkholderia sp. HI2714]
MRGADRYTETMFTIARLDDFVPANHPLRPIRIWLNDALRRAWWSGQRDRWIRQPDGSRATGMSVRCDGEQWAILYGDIALGLAWHHGRR